MHQTGARRRPLAGAIPPPSRKRRPEPGKTAGALEFDTEFGGRIEDGGPGKNILIRNRYVREDTGTHDTLKIIDDSMLEPDEPAGFDPYNTGRFDRSRNWSSHSK